MKERILTMSTFWARIKNKIILFRDNTFYIRFPWIEYLHEVYIKGRKRSYYSKHRKRWMYESGDGRVIRTVPIRRLTEEEKTAAYKEFQEGGCICTHQLFINKNKKALESSDD